MSQNTTSEEAVDALKNVRSELSQSELRERGQSAEIWFKQLPK